VDSIGSGVVIVAAQRIGIKGRHAVEGIVGGDAVVTSTRRIGIHNMWGFIKFF